MKTKACGHSSIRKIVLISVSKPQMGARSSEHGEEIEKCRKFLKELCKEASGNQILCVGDSGEKGIVLTRVIMLLMV